jgi:hypothetical protein
MRPLLQRWCVTVFRLSARLMFCRPGRLLVQQGDRLQLRRRRERLLVREAGQGVPLLQEDGRTRGLREQCELHLRYACILRSLISRMTILQATHALAAPAASAVRRARPTRPPSLPSLDAPPRSVYLAC